MCGIRIPYSECIPYYEYMCHTIIPSLTFVRTNGFVRFVFVVRAACHHKPNVIPPTGSVAYKLLNVGRTEFRHSVVVISLGEPPDDDDDDADNADDDMPMVASGSDSTTPDMCECHRLVQLK